MTQFPMTHRLCLFLLLTSSLLIAGCSGGDDESSGGSTSEKKRIVILTNGPDPFWDTCEAGAKQAEEELGLAGLGYEVDFQRGDFTDQAQIDKLKGNITELDLVGTYDVYLLGISMDDPGTVQTFNEMSSYAFTGTAVFTGDFRGSLNGTIAGRVMIEQTPDQIWAADGGSFQVTGGDDGDFTWSYSKNVLTITVDDDVQFKDYALSVAVGGRVLVGASGGPPSNNQQLTVWTRRP